MRTATELRTEEMNMVNGGVINCTTSCGKVWFEIRQDKSPYRQLAILSSAIDWDDCFKVFEQAQAYALAHNVTDIVQMDENTTDIILDCIKKSHKES